MKIGIIGSGNIGGTVAQLFSDAGHQVAISNSRGPQSLKDLEKSEARASGGKDSNIRAVTIEEAIAFGDVILIAIPWIKRQELPPSHLFNDKIVIDAMNPYSENFQVINLEPSSSSEEVAKQLNGARIVKAFNTMYFQHLKTKGNTNVPKEDRIVLFVAGDDAQAKSTVSKLIYEIGFASADTGSLREGGRKQQPGSAIYNNPMTSQVAQKKLFEIGK
jgi:8-hydroxy-5-deazaflavin:NADPH oxidoreductase